MIISEGRGAIRGLLLFAHRTFAGRHAMTIVSDIEILKRQEGALRFEGFTEEDAWTLGSMMREKAVVRNLPIVIDIRACDRQLFFCALPGTTPDNANWVRRKINVVTRYHKSSYRVGRELAASGTQLDEARGVLPIDHAPHGGCFPIHINGTGVAGTITVSGLPQREDHRFVTECLGEFLRVDLATMELGADT
jgi:uncharacterized protein (UPF0303 family)